MENINAYTKALIGIYGIAPEIKVIFVSDEDGWCASIEIANGAGLDEFGPTPADAIANLDLACIDMPEFDDEPGMP